MISEAYVSFETAKLLKEKGFNESCNRVYQGPNLKYTTLDISPLMALGELGGFHPKQLYVTNDELGDIVYTAPTQQMAMRWLREVHNIHIELNPICYGDTEEDIKWHYGWAVKTTIFTDRWKRHNAEHISYEQACEAALKYSLENLI